MAARRSIGAAAGAMLLACTFLGIPTRALALPDEPRSNVTVADCSDSDSFGGPHDVGDNRLTVERPTIFPPAYRLVARWRRWDGQDLAALASGELGRAINWNSPRLVLRLREDSPAGVTILTQEQILDTAAFPSAELPGGAQATVDVEPSLLRPKSGGSVLVKIRVERPGLDLATCWAAIPTPPSHGGAASSASALDQAPNP